jgi:hypothetical protein
MNKKIWKIKFDGFEVCDSEPLWKQILWVSLYEWDETPYGLTIRVLGFNIDFFIGEWIEE